MGFLKKLLGGKEEKAQPVRRAQPPSPRTPKATPAAQKPEPQGPPPVEHVTKSVEEMDTKALLRALGTSSRESRERAAQQLKERHERQAIRPLMNAYLNYGDPAVLEALGSFGSDVTGPATNEAFDLSIMGERRARLMDVLGGTHDQSAINVVRDFVADYDKGIHVRASTALARLGDLAGVDRLAADLEQAVDPELRTMALQALHELGDVRGAREATAGHVERYLAEGGAIPKDIIVVAPRLADPGLATSTFIVQEIKATARDLVLVIGSAAGDMARSRQGELHRDLPGHSVYFLTPELVPEEQMNLLEEARDVASSKPEHTVLVIGVVPAPNDSPPLRHFLTTGKGGSQYSAKIIFIDPHEYMLLMDWYRYTDEHAEVETDFEVVLFAATPAESAISDEEYLIYQLTPDARKNDFARALLAHF